MVIDANAYTIMPIQNVELTAAADKIASILKRYDLQRVSVDVIAGVDQEKPYTHIRISDNDGRYDSLTISWEEDD